VRHERNALLNELKTLRGGRHDWEEHRCYLLGKIARQAEAIRKIQKVGWQPTVIIRELPFPDEPADLLPDVDPPRARSVRRLRPPVDTSLLYSR
jgi:hypothetical protein